MPSIVPLNVKVQAGAAAPDVARAATNLRDVAGAITAGAAVTGQPWAPMAGALSLAGIAGERYLAPALEWLGSDPPDMTFQVPVRLKRSHLNPSPRLDVDDPRVQHGLAAYQDVDFAAAALRAMLRAAERVEGARIAGDPTAASARTAELYRFRGEAVAGLREASNSQQPLGWDLKELRASDDEPRRSQGVLTDLLLESRVPRSIAKLPVPSDAWEGFEAAAQAVSLSAEACEKVASQLEPWEIPETE